jgi:hypothetical protein
MSSKIKKNGIRDQSSNWVRAIVDAHHSLPQPSSVDRRAHRVGESIF